MYNCVLVGYGEIGKSVFETFSKFHDIAVHDLDKGKDATKKVTNTDILLVAIPFSNDFVDIIKEYQEKFRPGTTIIFSTIPIGTCALLGAVHCPVEGKHPNLAKSIRETDKWLGGESECAKTFLTEAGFKVIEVEKPDYTEFLKMQSTTNYGLMIEYARYVGACCDQIGLDYELVKKFNGWYNTLYADVLVMPGIKRYILDVPTGDIGGHCVVPNAKLLDDIFPSPLLKEIYRKK